MALSTEQLQFLRKRTEYTNTFNKRTICQKQSHTSIRGNVGAQRFSQGHVSWRQEEPGINPPTSWLVDDQLYLPSKEKSSNSKVNGSKFITLVVLSKKSFHKSAEKTIRKHFANILKAKLEMKSHEMQTQPVFLSSSHINVSMADHQLCVCRLRLITA